MKIRFAFIKTVEIKGLCLQLKRSGTEYAAQKINFLTLAVANGVHFFSEKFHLVLTRYQELLLISFFITSTYLTHDVTNFIDFD